MKITLLGNTFRPTFGSNLVTGYDIASESLMYSIMRFSNADEIFCLYEPRQYQHEMLELLLKRESLASCKERVTLISEYDLLFRGMDRIKDTSVIHSVKEDVIPLVSIRERIGRPIPLTFTFHGLVEQHLIWDTFIPMIHLPFKPYDAVICTSNAVRQTLERMLERLERKTFRSGLGLHKYQLRLETIPLGIDTTFFKPLDKKRIRQEAGIPENAFVILWFGRFSDCYKADLFPLLHVFSQLVRLYPDKDLLLLLAGSQDRGTDYSEQLKKQMESLGIIDKSRIVFNNEIKDRAALYCVADLFTSPVDNIQETFGLTPIEAMACGVPQVVSDWDGYRDTVEDGKTGFRIKTAWCDCMHDVAAADFLPSNVSNRRTLQRYLAVRSTVVDCDDYLSKIKALIDNPDLLSRFSANSRIRAVEQYDIARTVKQTEKLWEKLINVSREQLLPFQPELLPMVDYCHDFKSYPSCMIDEDTCFEATRFCNLDYYDSLPQPWIITAVEESKICIELIRLLEIDGAATVQQIIDRRLGFTADQIKRAIMLLYKYNMIKVC